MSTILEIAGYALIAAAFYVILGLGAALLVAGVELVIIAHAVDGVSLNAKAVFGRLRKRSEQ